MKTKEERGHRNNEEKFEKDSSKIEKIGEKKGRNYYKI
jgi:hypothetical protein